MHVKFSPAIIALILLSLAGSSFAAPSINMKGEAHVGERVVVSVESSQIPSNGSVEWSVSPTSGKNPSRFSVRAGGRECTFTPLDTDPVRVEALFVDRDGEIVSTAERLVTPQEFTVNISVVVD